MNPIGERNKSIAWFNLQEYIKKGEREKTLNIYKLLSLSISNDAFKYKLLGDILSTLNENENAIKNYINSAKEYLNQNNLNLALEIINLLEKKEINIKQKNNYIEILIKSNLEKKAEKEIYNLITTCIKDKNFNFIEQTLKNAKNISNTFYNTQLKNVIIELTKIDDQEKAISFIKIFLQNTNKYETNNLINQIKHYSPSTFDMFLKKVEVAINE